MNQFRFGAQASLLIFPSEELWSRSPPRSGAGMSDSLPDPGHRPPSAEAASAGGGNGSPYAAGTPMPDTVEVATSDALSFESITSMISALPPGDGSPPERSVKMRALVIEDDPNQQQGLAARFSVVNDTNTDQLLFDLTFVSTGQEALDTLSEQREPGFDIILVDIGLPDMSGADLLKPIRMHVGQSTTVIVLSIHRRAG